MLCFCIRMQIRKTSYTERQRVSLERKHMYTETATMNHTNEMNPFTIGFRLTRGLMQFQCCYFFRYQPLFCHSNFDQIYAFDEHFSQLKHKSVSVRYSVCGTAVYRLKTISPFQIHFGINRKTFAHSFLN